MPSYALGGKRPRIDPSAVIAPNASIIGSVTIGARTSVWPGAVLRGDYGSIRIGTDCNIQDNVVVHCSEENDSIVGNGVTVAHSAVVHACRVGDECLIGVGAVIFDGATIGKHSIVGVGAIVPGGQRIPAGSVVVGVPAKVVRKVSSEDVKMLQESWKNYVQMSQRYAKNRTFERPLRENSI